MRQLKERFEFFEFEEFEKLSIFIIDDLSKTNFLLGIDFLEIHCHIEILTPFLMVLEKHINADRRKIVEKEKCPFLYVWEYVSICGATVRFIPSRWDFLKDKLAIRFIPGNTKFFGKEKQCDNK